MTDTWDDLLEKFIGEPQVEAGLKNSGFYNCQITFKKFVKNHAFAPQMSTPFYLSIDFWSGQSKILKENNLYLLRTGKGKFCIIDERKFPKPYLDLQINNTVLLEPKHDPNFAELEHAFDTKQENAGLERLNAFGIYDSLVEKLLGGQKWKLGPRGAKSSKFSVYAKTRSAQVEHIFEYDGAEELDYCIWTKDHILIFEAKSPQTHPGLDVGWHKIAFTASRFAEFKGHKIIPVYLLEYPRVSYLFVFPKFGFYKDGIIINDQDLMSPQTTFQVRF